MLTKNEKNEYYTHTNTERERARERDEKYLKKIVRRDEDGLLGKLKREDEIQGGFYTSWCI